MNMKGCVFMKKIITLTVALTALTASLVPLSANAVYIPAASYDEVQKQLEGYTYITEFAVQESDPNYPSDSYDLYIRMPEEADTTCEVKLLMKENYDTVDVTFPEGGGRKAITEAMQKAGIDGKLLPGDNVNCECRLYDKVSADKVKKLYTILNDSGNITDFVYSTDLYTIRKGSANSESLSRFGFCTYDYDKGIWTPPDEQIAKRERFVELTKEILPDAAVELTSFSDKREGFTAYEASVVPASSMTLKEWIDFSLEVNEKLGGFGGFGIAEEVEIPALKTNSVDLAKVVEGDANCNGTVDMSDAVLIMQTIANPSKYKLTAQGSFNADTDGDGITSGDALAIQKKLLKLE